MGKSCPSIHSLTRLICVVPKHLLTKISTTVGFMASVKKPSTGDKQMRGINIQSFDVQGNAENIITALGLLGACALLASLFL
jgi:hypothetical protein